MAAVASSPSLPSSGAPQSRHFLAHSAPYGHAVGPALSAHLHNGYEAFASHGHGHTYNHYKHAPSPASTTSSWRVRAPVSNAPAPAPGQKPRRRVASPSSPTRLPSSRTHSHSRNDSSSSTASLTSSRRPSPPSSIAASPVKQAVELRSQDTPSSQLTVASSSAPLVYTPADLLRLSFSPLVGLSPASQAVVSDLVAHHVWRRSRKANQGSDVARGRKPHEASEAGHSATDSDSSN
ncbi:hypothetical protein HETIRDRAFT_325943 [Heterobasidion irregulare TC 32-1]|uniref:Uncharacterized protein n=1 Tax=Heterobasidion irregulare (strain TC 32-1) TaxID=747525 RepID=W4JW81_HETIT|nr:uncharacterized protein HETIRDRAFT_325943 [Heterobasidion irregulare TC 32-1]ETW77813.1 hypothetical protein HETIRDRAFT_325943 [Heterobasidion irregulare TC 32-1]